MSPIRILLLIGLLLISIPTSVHAQDTQTHIVQRGETLYRISRMYNMSVDQLRRLNALTGNIIKPGQVLRVSATGEPNTPPPSATPAPTRVDPQPPPVTRTTVETNSEPFSVTTDQASHQRRRYIVQPGDTYYTIGLKYGVPAYAIFALNSGRTTPLEAREAIWIPDVPLAQQNTLPAVTRRRITVKQGDTLFGIAQEYAITVSALRNENGLSSDLLSIGQVLTIPEDEPEPVEQQEKRLLPEVYQTGKVVMYEATFAGRRMAVGRPYDPSRFSVSHQDLPLESIVLLTNLDTGERTFAEVTDRGPLDTINFVMDVSEAVANALGINQNPNARIEIRVVE